jgi:hypothetical protein
MNKTFKDCEYYNISREYLINYGIRTIKPDIKHIEECRKYYLVLDEVINKKSILLIDKNFM